MWPRWCFLPGQRPVWNAPKILFPIGTGRVIKGWDGGVLSIKVGGKRELLIPPSLGYGSRGAGSGIPSDATLLFEVELLKIRGE